MTNSTRLPVVRKPSPDFPLFPHQSGRWAKKVRGKLCYFGKTADDTEGKAALLVWLEQKDELLAGRKPRSKDGLTVLDLCTQFLLAKQKLCESGDLAPVTFRNHKDTCKKIVSTFGQNRLVEDLRPDDFDKLRADAAKAGGPTHVGNVVQRTRVVFKYAFDAGLVAAPVRYGPSFKKPSKRVMRNDKAVRGSKMLEASDIQKLLKAADVQLKAMILLAVNCGFGNSDCGTLPLSSLDLRKLWISYHRQKTGIDRRCPLWPETAKAVKEALDKRPTPKTSDTESLVFVTKYGAAWAKDSADNAITSEFRKLLDETKLHRPGLGFYTLRHVFRTIADGSRDQVAVNSIMGHADASMAGVYRERIEDERLRSVANYVRKWLFPPAKKQAQKRRQASGSGE